MTALHQKSIAFVQCACALDTCGNVEENNEIALYLIGLVNADQKGQQIAARSKGIKIAPSVAAVPSAARAREL